MKKICIFIAFVVIILVFLTSCYLSEAVVNNLSKNLFSDYEKYEIYQIDHDIYEIEINDDVYSNHPYIYFYWQPIIQEDVSVIGISDFNGVTLVYSTTSPWQYKIDNVNADMSRLVPANIIVYNTEVDSTVGIKYDGSKNWEPSSFVSVDIEQFSNNNISGFSYVEGVLKEGLRGYYYTSDEIDPYMRDLSENLICVKDKMDELENYLTDLSIIAEGINAIEYDRTNNVFEPGENTKKAIPIGNLHLFADADIDNISSDTLCMTKIIYILLDQDQNNRYILRDIDGEKYFVDITDLIKK